MTSNATPVYEYEGSVPPKVPLPDGWVCFSDDDGEEYYFRPETGETVWEVRTIVPIVPCM